MEPEPASKDGRLTGCSHLDRRYDGVYECDGGSLQGTLDCCGGCPAMLPP